MYIQQEPDTPMPFTIPKGYRGSAFQEPPTPPPTPEESAPEESTPVPDTSTPTAAAEPQDTHDAPTQAFARIPFLSSLLPPPRKKREGTGLPEWALLALIFFVLNESREGDLLPILLLLLLWD